LGERLNGIQEVSGSTPLGSTKSPAQVIELILKYREWDFYPTIFPAY
jgi:hypothetical protein